MACRWVPLEAPAFGSLTPQLLAEEHCAFLLLPTVPLHAGPSCSRAFTTCPPPKTSSREGRRGFWRSSSLEMCPMLKGTTWPTHCAFLPRSGVVGSCCRVPKQLLWPFSHLPPLFLSFSTSLLMLLAGCWAGSPTGMLWGNYGARGLVGCCCWECRGVAAAGAQSVPHLGGHSAAFSGAAARCSAGSPEG